MNKPLPPGTPNPFHTPHRLEPLFPAAPMPAKPPAARYPLKISGDRRRLLDADDKPFLIQGDAAWSLIANLTYEQAVHYLDDRRAKGFNTVIVNLIEHSFSRNPPRDLAGNEPFTKPGDFGTPNDAYFDAAGRVLDACAERGIMVLLACCYIGYERDFGRGESLRMEGWNDEIVATGPAGCRAYGEYLGRRFGHHANIVWMIGGDWHPLDARPGLEAIAEGIRGTGVKNLFTAHVHPEYSPIESFAGSRWLDVNVTYTYGIVHRKLLVDWERNPVWPTFLIESTYEGEHNASPLQIRRQAYWSVLCGGNGHCMGNQPIWLFWDGWERALDYPGSIAMARWGDFFRALPWSELVPDIRLELVVWGLGEARGLDRVTAAMTADRRLGVAYLPVRRPVGVDLSVLVGPRLAAEWFEPASGRRFSGGILAAAGRVHLAPPFEEDAVLLLQSVA
jgi:hypothetical protein